ELKQSGPGTTYIYGLQAFKKHLERKNKLFPPKSRSVKDRNAPSEQIDAAHRPPELADPAKYAETVDEARSQLLKQCRDAAERRHIEDANGETILEMWELMSESVADERAERAKQKSRRRRCDD